MILVVAVLAAWLICWFVIVETRGKGLHYPRHFVTWVP
jgi:hypothetical protein